MTFRSTLLSFLALAVSAAALAHEGDHPVKHDRSPHNLGDVLVFSGTGWYRHPETASINGWLAQLSDELGMQVDVTETPKDLESILKHYDVLVMNNCNELTSLLTPEQMTAVENWYKQGGGIVALHAAIVHQTEWTWFTELAGCDFDSDSEYLEARVVVDPAAKNHPTVKGHGKSFMYWADWTNHTASVTGKPGFQVLLRVDESTYAPVRELFIERGGKAMGADHPVAWTNTLNDGRFLYTEFGHDVDSLEPPFGRQHILEAIKWAARKD